jgi:hypothetical protein
LILAASGAAFAQQQQPQQTNTIGPAQLKDFQLPGQRTTPPAQTPPATQPQTQPQSQPPAATTPPRTEPRPAPVDTPRTEPPRDSAPSAAEPEPLLLPDATAELPVEGNLALPEAEAPLPEGPGLDVLPPPVAAEEEPEPGASWLSWWPWLAVPAALALLAWAGLAWRRRREAAAEEAVREAARQDLGGVLFAGGAAGAPEAAPERTPEPAPPIPAAPAPAAEAEPRPWLEVEVKPERAAATDVQAVVDYALSVVNSGDAPARNIRIDARLFNASAQDEVNAFIAGPIHEKSGSPHVVLAPGESLELMGQAAMAKADVREVKVEGRSLLIPMIAINVAYDWGEAGAGRTSRSWVVGRQPETPAARMGAFRLDLGPRIYRAVAGREAQLVKV